MGEGGKLTYEERLLVVEDHKRYGTAYTSWKRGLSERYVRTIRNIQNKLDMILLGCSNFSFYSIFFSTLFVDRRNILKLFFLT